MREVNRQQDKNGVSYARRAMRRIRMALNLNILWEEKQLSEELQAIIARHRTYFDVKMIDE